MDVKGKIECLCFQTPLVVKHYRNLCTFYFGNLLSCGKYINFEISNFSVYNAIFQNIEPFRAQSPLRCGGLECLLQEETLSISFPPRLTAGDWQVLILTGEGGV